MKKNAKKTLEELRKIGRAEGKESFYADLRAGDVRTVPCPAFPLIVRKMKAAGYDIGDREETIQAAFEFATAFRDEYTWLYFRQYAP